MADKTVSLKLKVDASNAAQSVGDLKKSIRDLQTQALKAGENSLLGQKFLKQAADAKDRLSDLTRQVANFQDAGSKFGAVTKLVGGLASGFQAAQGAAALFGSSGEDLQKVLVKVQAATALAQGVQGFAGLGENLKDMGLLIRGSIVSAFGSLKAAIISTGIGALAAAAYLLYSNFDKVKQVLANIIPEPVQKAFGVLKDAIGFVVDKAKDLVGLGDSTTGVLKTMGTFGTFLNNTLKTTYETQQKGFTAIKDYNEKLKEQAEYIKKLTEAGAAGSIGYYNFLLGESNKKLETLVPGSDSYNNELRKQIALQNELTELQENQKLLQGTPDALPQKQEETGLVEVGGVKKIEMMKTQIIIDESSKRDLVAKKEAANRKQYLAAIVASSQGVLSSVASLGEIFIRNQKKQEQFQKKIAVAQLLIDTASGISSVVREGIKVGFPAAIPIIAGGIAMVIANMAKAKALLSKAGDVSVPSLDSGGAVAGGGGATATPNIDSPTTQLNEPPPPAPVLVVETYHNAAHRINVIESRARFD